MSAIREPGEGRHVVVAVADRPVDRAIAADVRPIDAERAPPTPGARAVAGGAVPEVEVRSRPPRLHAQVDEVGIEQRDLGVGERGEARHGRAPSLANRVGRARRAADVRRRGRADRGRPVARGAVARVELGPRHAGRRAEAEEERLDGRDVRIAEIRERRHLAGRTLAAVPDDVVDAAAAVDVGAPLETAGVRAVTRSAVVEVEIARSTSAATAGGPACRHQRDPLEQRLILRASGDEATPAPVRQLAARLQQEPGLSGVVQVDEGDRAPCRGRRVARDHVQACRLGHPARHVTLRADGAEDLRHQLPREEVGAALGGWSAATRERQPSTHRVPALTDADSPAPRLVPGTPVPSP